MPGEIIPECRAKSSRNAERHQIGMLGDIIADSRATSPGIRSYSSPEDLLGEEGLFKQLKKRLLERALGAELSEHLGYERGDPAGRGSGNSRNSYSNKTVIGDDGAKPPRLVHSGRI